MNECHYCGTEVGPAGSGLPLRTKDHIVCTARGGRDLRLNIVISCQSCNERKSDAWLLDDHDCNKCRRARRYHRERFGIHEFSPRPKKSS